MSSKRTVERRSDTDEGVAVDLIHVIGLTALIVGIAALVASGVAFGDTITTTVLGTLVAAPLP